jgi:hypothetical protein
MLHAVREISKVTRNKLDLRHIHVKKKEMKEEEAAFSLLPVSCCVTSMKKIKAV